MSDDGHRFFPESRSLLDDELGRVIPTIDETSVQPIVGGEPADGEPGPGYLGVSISKRKIAVFFAVIFLALGGLAARAAMLDIRRGESYRRQAEGNRLRIVPVPSERGIIFDRNGVLLARNVPDFTLTVTPADLPRDDKARTELFVKLAEAVDLTPIDIEQSLKRYPSSFADAVPIKEHLDYDEAVKMTIGSGLMPGVDVQDGTKREYLLDPTGRGTPALSLSHILGYEGRISESELAAKKNDDYEPTDLIGKTGIEASHEKDLRGVYGRKQIEVDAFGREQTVLSEDAAVQGKDLTLSIDSKLQAEAERSLRAAALRNGPGRGVAIALDPKTGEVLAMVSLPAFNDNDFAQGIKQEEYRALAEDKNQPLYPRAIAGLYPPGSTIKLTIAAAALAERVITPSTTFISTGGIRVGQWFFPDWKLGGHGATNVTKAIADSVNTFFYAVGGGWNDFIGLGIDRLDKYFAKFGLGDKLGIDLPGERDGFLPDPAWKKRVKGQPWAIGDTYHVSIGQGDLLVTPLQVAEWTSVFANGGNLMRPRVVKSSRSGSVIEETKPEIISRQVVSPDIISTVRQAMRQTVLNGSAQSLQLSPWAIAGKTGTAEWRTGQPAHAWFTGFAPYEDPKIAVTVLIEAGGEGSTVAVPVARDIIETYLRSQKIPGRYVQSASGTAQP